MKAPRTLALGLILATSCANCWSKTVHAGVLDTPFLNGNDTESIPLVCSTEKSVIRPAESVVLRAWAKVSVDQKVEYAWSVTAGSIAGSGHQVTWNLKGPKAGIYTAVVKVGGSGFSPASCSLSVAIVEPERGVEVVRRDTGRGFLVKGETKEGEGYGLYSYLLFGSPPTTATRERYLKTVEAYLRFVEVSQFEEDAYPRSKLNVTYLPLAMAGKQDVNAAWILEHYDYARGRILLDSLPGDRRVGIYLVSCLRPLSASPNPPYLVQDLSTVPTAPDDLISWWVDEFLSQAAQEHFWETNTTRLLALRMRTTIAVLAAGLPEVQKSLSSWIAWLH